MNKELIIEKKITTTKDNELYRFDPEFSQIEVPSNTEVDYERHDLTDESGKLQVVHHTISYQGHSLKSVCHQYDPDHKDYGGQWVLLNGHSRV